MTAECRGIKNFINFISNNTSGLSDAPIFEGCQVLHKNYELIEVNREVHRQSLNQLVIYQLTTTFQIGVDFALKVLHRDKKCLVRLQLWDVAGKTKIFSAVKIV